MKGRHLSSLLILTAALGIAVFVIYDHRTDSASEDPLSIYLENEGIEDVDSRAEGETEEYLERDKEGIQPGMLLKDVPLPLVDGEGEMAISDFRGHYVILNVWATWCAPCREEKPDLTRIHREYYDEGVRVVGLNRTSQESDLDNIHRFLEEFDVTYPNLMDEEDEAARAYQVIGMPLTYVLDPDGRIITRRQGMVNYDMLTGDLETAREKYEETE
ncbi:TlpA disulfide reductase family protein [Alteribacter natronophilus]|uniref:TlpA disulfide reductase family protein n=1 Tax=Alteribacter natronophilus TaxID=2583810 RepID=UPI00110DD9EB|nr:TlpA disulfide reductase family protein [Alteribacter natronophilus]TMW73690.1 TlpA family protein disulfide reductase [Alteribacter natronophilus]